MYCPGEGGAMNWRGRTWIEKGTMGQEEKNLRKFIEQILGFFPPHFINASPTGI